MSYTCILFYILNGNTYCRGRIQSQIHPLENNVGLFSGMLIWLIVYLTLNQTALNRTRTTI